LYKAKPLKNRKEYVVCENELGRVWRISKRLCRLKKAEGFKYVSKVLHLHIAENRFWFKWSNISTTTTVQGTVSFSVKDGKIKITTKNKGSYNCSYQQLAVFSNLGQKVNAKINRVLNKEFGLKFKIGKPFYVNLLNRIYPQYAALYKSPTFHMVKVFKKTSVKESIRSYCGFAGKKFLAKLFQLSEPRQLEILDTIRMFRRHLTFGEIHTKIHPVTGFKTKLKPLIGINPVFFKSLFIRKQVQGDDNIAFAVNFSSWQIDDMIRMYTEIANTIDIESTPLALSKAKKLNEYHDELANYHKKLRYQNVPFKPLEFDGAELGDFTIRTCKDSHQLIEWSTHMGNCVSSYRGDIIAGTVIMCGLFRGEDLVYNLSLTPVGKKFRIQQLNCRYNKGYTPEDYSLVESFLGDRNVLSGQKKTVGIGCQ
jgi:hypothetical protein